jgi:hypothetical protein
MAEPKCAVTASLLAVALLYLGTACQREGSRPGAAVTAPAAPPVIKVTGDRGEADLGRVAPGSAQTVIFEIVNSSAQPLKLVRVQSTCDCTRVRQSPDQIPAGASARVEVVFEVPDAIGVKAPYTSELLVLTDAPNRKLIHLVIRSVGKG